MNQFTCRIIIFALLLFPIVASGEASSADKLKEEKITLEIEKLRKEIDSISVSPWLQLATVGIALIAAGVSFWSAWRSQRSAAESMRSQLIAARQDRISQLLTELGNGNPAIRAATIQALGEYESAATYLVNLLKHEKNRLVLDTLYLIISKHKAFSLKLLMELSRRLNRQRVVLAGTLLACDIDIEEVCRISSVTKSHLVQWRDSAAGKRHISGVMAQQNFHGATQQHVRKSKVEQDAKEEIESISFAIDVLIQATESTLRQMSNDSLIARVHNGRLPGIVLDDLDLAGWEFDSCLLEDASFRGALGRGVVFKNCRIGGASFKGSDFRDSEFIDCDMDRVSFNNARLIRCKFSNSTAYGAKFVAVKLRKADFSNARIVQADFVNAVGEDINFEKAHMMGAKFSGARMPKACFKEAKLDGSDFTGSSTTGADFEGASVRGAVNLNV